MTSLDDVDALGDNYNLGDDSECEEHKCCDVDSLCEEEQGLASTRAMSVQSSPVTVVLVNSDRAPQLKRPVVGSVYFADYGYPESDDDLNEGGEDGVDCGRVCASAECFYPPSPSSTTTTCHKRCKRAPLRCTDGLLTAKTAAVVGLGDAVGHVLLHVDLQTLAFGLKPVSRGVAALCRRALVSAEYLGRPDGSGSGGGPAPLASAGAPVEPLRIDIMRRMFDSYSPPLQAGLPIAVQYVSELRGPAPCSGERAEAADQQLCRSLFLGDHERVAALLADADGRLPRCLRRLQGHEPSAPEWTTCRGCAARAACRAVHDRIRHQLGLCGLNRAVVQAASVGGRLATLCGRLIDVKLNRDAKTDAVCDATGRWYECRANGAVASHAVDRREAFPHAGLCHITMELREGPDGDGEPGIYDASMLRGLKTNVPQPDGRGGGAGGPVPAVVRDVHHGCIDFDHRLPSINTTTRRSDGKGVRKMHGWREVAMRNHMMRALQPELTGETNGLGLVVPVAPTTAFDLPFREPIESAHRPQLVTDADSDGHGDPFKCTVVGVRRADRDGLDAVRLFCRELENACRVLNVADVVGRRVCDLTEVIS